MGSSKDQKGSADAGNTSGSKFQSAFLQAAYRDDSSHQQANSSRGNRNFQGVGMHQQPTMDETRLTTEGRNQNLQAKYGGGDTSERYGYGASPQNQHRYGSKFRPYPNRGATAANESQRISYLQSDSSFKSARVSAIGRNFDSNRGQYQTENDKRMPDTAGSAQGSDLPGKQTAFQGCKRSMQIMPYNKIDLGKQPENGPAQTYWQFKRDAPGQGNHVKSSSSDLGMQQRHGSAGPKGLNGIGDDGSYQNTDRGPVTYQRAGALTSPQAQFGAPKRLTTQKLSMLSASSDKKKNQQPYLANLRGKRSVNNYQDQKKVLGQTIDDSEMNSVAKGEPAPQSQRGQGPRTGMRPSLKPAGPTLAQKKNKEGERAGNVGDWTSGRKGDYQFPNDRPSEVREEEQPYYMRAPFNAHKSYLDPHNGHGMSISPNRSQAVANYGLMQYSNRAISPQAKGAGRPGTSLGGRIGIRKLSKLDAKEQDDVHEVTEDEDRMATSPRGLSSQLRTDIPPAYSRDPYQSQGSNYQTPFNKAENAIEHTRGTGRDAHPETNRQRTSARKAYTFGKPNSTQRTLALPVEETPHLIHNSQKVRPEPEDSSDQDDNQQLREEYLKVKRELEMLKRSGRQKMRSPVPSATDKGKSMMAAKGGAKERPTSSQCVEQQDLRRPVKRDAQEDVEQQRSPEAGRDVEASDDEADAVEDRIKQQFEDTRKRDRASFNQEDLYQLSSKSPRDNQGMWQDKVEQRIEKLNKRLSDYYQRADPEEDNAGSAALHATPRATEGTDGVFRGSFSRSASISRFQNPQQTMTGNRIQFQSSATSSQQSQDQQSNGVASPPRSQPRVSSKGLTHAQQQSNSKKVNQQVHGLYSAAGAGVGTQSRRQGTRKGSTGPGVGAGISKSLKSTAIQNNNQGLKPGLKGTNSYTDVQVIEVNDSRVVGDGQTANRGQNANNNQPATRSIISQNSQTALLQNKQNLPKKAKGKAGGSAAAQKNQALLKVSRSGDRKEQSKEPKGEFRGSFQNKGHRLWAATPLETQPNDSPRQKQKSRRQQPLNVKSFNSDRSAGSEYGDGYDRQGPEYSASASNNSEDNKSPNERANRDDEDDSSNENEQSTIGTQYSQIVNIRTKHRHGISSRRSKGKSSQRARKKAKASEEQAAEKTDRRWPVTTIDLESGRRTARGATPDYSKKARQSAREGSPQRKSQTDQARVILECQKQIQELQAQLSNLTHFPGQGTDSSQGSVLMVSKQQRQTPISQGASMIQANATMQGPDIMMQPGQFAGPVQVGHPNQMTYGAQTPTGATTSMHMGLNSNSMLGQHPIQYPGAPNPHQLHAGAQLGPMQMPPSHAAEFQQYELRIRQLQEQIREQQLQLQLQEQKHEHVLWTQRTLHGQPAHPATPTVEQSTPLQISTPQQSSVPYQGLSPLPDLLHSSTIPTHHQMASTATGAPQLASFTTPLTPITPIAPTHPQRPGSGIGICQFVPPDTSNITQNNSNFFSQINEIARNIDERGGQQIGKGGSIDTMGLSAEKFGARDDTLVQVVVQDDDEVDAAVDVQHETDMEMTELEAAKVGSAVRPDGFTGFETSIVDTNTREAKPSMHEKGSFAPLPEHDDQIREEQSEYSSKKRIYDEPVAKDPPVEENYISGTFSPDFVVREQKKQPIQWIHGAKVDNDGDAPSEAVKLEDQVEDDEANQSASKQEQLLVIGFDEKPKGVNPLSRLRSPGGIGANERSRQKPQMNIFNSRGGKTLGESSKNTAGRVTLEISQSSRTSQIQTSLTPKGHPIAQINLQQSTDDNQSQQKVAEMIQVGDDVPSLQDYARLKSGRAAKLQSARRNHVSPQPRKSNAFNQVQNGGGFGHPAAANNPFNQRQDKSQPPKQPRETKTKEELARIRKQMMKSKFKDRNDNLNSKSTAGARDGTIETSSGFIFTTHGNLETESNVPAAKLQKADHPRSDLLSRLASGTKAKIDKQSMRRLTKGNYEKLPEILKKKEDAKKQEELSRKKERAMAYQKELDLRLRTSLKKKKEKDGKR